MSYFANLDCDGLLEKKHGMHYYRRESFGQSHEKPLRDTGPAPERISYYFCSCGEQHDICEDDLTPVKLWRKEHESRGHHVESTYRWDYGTQDQKGE